MTSRNESTIRELLERATAALDTDTAQLDAEVLLAGLLNRDRSHLYAWPEKNLPHETCVEFLKRVQRRAQGEPVAYLTGRREFWSLPLEVNRATLIPRPETETLVALALERIPHDARLRIADLGTGSGAIALAIAIERPQCEVVASDISADALAVAAGNAARLGLANLEFVHGNWCTPFLHSAFDLVLSNPPYVEDEDAHLRQGDVRFEPRSALAAGPDGMRDLQRIIGCARHCLRAGGWLLLEHGFRQAGRVRRELEANGYSKINCYRDHAGLERVSVAQRAS